MFSEEFVKELAKAIAQELRPANHVPARWPELMDIDTAAQYMCRTPDGVRTLIKKRLIPVTKIDARIQLRRVDIDRLIEKKTA